MNPLKAPVVSSASSSLPLHSHSHPHTLSVTLPHAHLHPHPHTHAHAQSHYPGAGSLFHPGFLPMSLSHPLMPHGQPMKPYNPADNASASAAAMAVLSRHHGGMPMNMPMSMPLAPQLSSSHVASASPLHPPAANRSQEKIKKRLARKAELARASRRRKKAFVGELQDRVITLTGLANELYRALQGAPLTLPNNIQFPLQLPPQLAGIAAGGVNGAQDDSEEETDDEESGKRESVSPEPAASAALQQQIESAPMHTIDSSAVFPSAADSIALSPPSDDLVRCFKCVLGSDTRRFSLAARQLSLDSITETIRKLYYPMLGERFHLFYRDEDNDRISIATTDELSEAIKLSGAKQQTNEGKTLKLYIEPIQEDKEQAEITKRKSPSSALEQSAELIGNESSKRTKVDLSAGAAEAEHAPK